MKRLITLAALIVGAAILVATTRSRAAGPFYASPTGSGTTCTLTNPCSLATATSNNGGAIVAGASIILRGGIYRVSPTAGVTFSVAGTSPTVLTVYSAYPGERPIITDTSDNPPNVHMASYQRLDGLWFGGTRQNADTTGIFNGGSPVSHWTQIVNCTIWGYYGAIKDSSAEYVLYQNDRFVRTGGGTLYHGLYISGPGSWPPTPGTLGTHHIVDNNLFIAGKGGYGVHMFHNNRTAITTRNFVNGNWGSVFDGYEGLVANNFYWKTSHDSSNEAMDALYSKNSIYQNNILGVAANALNPYDTSVLITTNAFETATTGANPITVTPGQEAAQIGASATTIDNAIAALDTSFSASTSTILADSTIETNFAVIKNITVPNSSGLYHTGQPWFDTNPINIGPNCGAPASVAAFWTAFTGLGLVEYDSNGNPVAATPTPTPTATSTPTPTPTPPPIGAPIQDALVSGTKNGATPLTMSLTVTQNAHRVLIVGVASDTVDNSHANRPTVTYAGVSMTESGLVEAGGKRTQLFTLVDPTSGTNNVVVAWAGGNTYIVAGAVSFSAVDTTGTPFGTVATNSGTSAAPTVTVSSGTYQTVIDVLTFNRTGALTVSPSAGQTALWNVPVTADQIGASSTKAGATSTVMSWTASGSQAWTVAGVGIHGIGAPTPTPTPTPIPTPTPTPTPTPLPACGPNQIIGRPPVCSCQPPRRALGNPKRCR